MRGHQQSAVRKLNRHWQSGGGKKWSDSYPYALSNPSSPSYPYNNFPSRINNYSNASSYIGSSIWPYQIPYDNGAIGNKSLVVPSSGIITIEMYAELLRFDDPSIIEIGVGNSNGYTIDDFTFDIHYYANGVWDYLTTGPLITTQSGIKYPLTNISNFVLKNNLYNNFDNSTANPVSRYCISKDKNNPSVFALDLLSIIPNAEKYYIVFTFENRENFSHFNFNCLTRSFPAGIKFDGYLREERSEIGFHMRAR